MTRHVPVWTLSVGLVLAACSGRVGVGFEPVDDPNGSGGSAGSGAGQGDPSAGTSSGGTQAMAGQGPVIGDDDPAGVCSFSPSQLGPDSRPLLTSVEVLSRIYVFLDNDPQIPQGALPAEPNPSWAAARAKEILDVHRVEGTPAPGLVRFLDRWLDMYDVVGDPDIETPTRWALKLVQPDATLSTLLAEPTGEPHRIGILTEPEFLRAHPTISQRGTWMSSRLLCREVPPPPPSLEETLGEGVTRREQLESAVSPAPCAACHALIDPAGSSLEHFDEVGDYREQDNGQPVNAAATLNDPPLSFDGYSELAPQLATSCQVGRCFAQLLGSDAFGPPLPGIDPRLSEAELNRVAEQFASSGYSIRVLVESIVRSPSFLR